MKSIQQNEKVAFLAFIDFEKAYDTNDRHGMWQMLRGYGVQENC